MLHVVTKYLDINNYSNLKESFVDFFQSHPNYPSLFAVTDSFDLLNIENIAVKIPKEQFTDLPEVFLAFVKEELVLVSKINSSIAIENEKKQSKNISTNDFLSDWNGVILAIESNINAIRIDTKPKFNNSRYLIPVLILVFISAFNNLYTLHSSLTLITTFVGLCMSVLILQEKFGIKNEITSKFCNLIPEASCDSVINSEKNNFNKWLSFSDLPFIYFGICFLSLLIDPTNSSFIIGGFSVLSIPILVYSVWAQKFQLKKWCVLCLAISVIILFQVFIFSFYANNSLNYSFNSLFSFSFSAVFVSTIWMFLKPKLEKEIISEKLNNEAKKFKRNYPIFNYLTKGIKIFEGFNKLQGISFGNSSADLKLSIVISPSCGHCHSAFHDGFKLVKNFPDKVCFNVLFNINPENNNNPYKIIVERLLNINYRYPKKIEEAITDWHIKKMDLETWLKKWPIEVIDMRVNHQIQLQYDWCLENDFNYTPVKLINNKLFPNEYEISELKYFLNNFSEKDQVLEGSILIEV